MKILIVGAGGVGFMLCEHLMNAHEVIVVDKNIEAVENINSQLDVLAIKGDGKNPKLYENIDKNIDIFIAVTNSDETNILTSLMVDEILQVKKKIVRLNDDFYDSDSIREKLGLTHIIFPIKETLSRIKRMLDFPHAQSIKSLENTNYTLSSITLTKLQNPITQDEFSLHVNKRVAICGIERGDRFFIPTKEDGLQKDDLVYLLCKSDDLESLGKEYGRDYPDISGCVVFGADTLGVEAAKLLLENGINIRVFEKDINLCKKAQEELGSDVSIYHTRYGLDHHFKKDEMQNAQMVIATTEEDEYNLVKCLEAKYNSIPKVVAINNDLEYTSLMRNAKIEIIRGTKSSAFYGILEKLDDINIIVTKRFCAKTATVLLRQTYGLVTQTSIKDFTPKTKQLGLFFIIRGEEILRIDESSSIMQGDILVACSQSEKTLHVKKWLEKQF